MSNCIFCKIAAGELSSHRVWEDEHHLAFLSLHPNTEGFTVVITKEHHDSYFADLAPSVRHKLIDVASAVAKRIDAAFQDVGRTGLIFEGFGVNHIHAKLVPMHGTVSDAWQQRARPIDTYFEQYPGYISSHDAAPAQEQQLAAVAKKIRDATIAPN